MTVSGLWVTAIAHTSFSAVIAPACHASETNWFACGIDSDYLFTGDRLLSQRRCDLHSNCSDGRSSPLRYKDNMSVNPIFEGRSRNFGFQKSLEDQLKIASRPPGRQPGSSKLLLAADISNVIVP